MVLEAEAIDEDQVLYPRGSAHCTVLGPGAAKGASGEAHPTEVPTIVSQGLVAHGNKNVPIGAQLGPIRKPT